MDVDLSASSSVSDDNVEPDGVQEVPAVPTLNLAEESFVSAASEPADAIKEPNAPASVRSLVDLSRNQDASARSPANHTVIGLESPG